MVMGFLNAILEKPINLVYFALAGMFYHLRFHLEIAVLICYDAGVIHMYQYM